MNATRERGMMVVGFLAGFFAVGLPYWSTPYSELGLQTLIGPALLVVLLAALLLRATGTTSVWRATLASGASVPACVLARVGVDVAADPTSHNLWPFEFIISLAIGMAAGLAGAVLGLMIAWLHTIGTERS